MPRGDKMIQETRAYKYALQCANDSSGRVGRYVRKQCQQWLDIADGKTSDCYVSEKAYKKIHNILKLMIHPDLNYDMTAALDDYAILFITAVLCTYNKNGGRKYTTGILEIARKNHKTFTAAVIFIILMLTEPRFSRLFSVAPDYKLSSELRLAARKIILVSPMLSKHFKITRDMITCKLTDIEYTPLAYSNDRLDGKLANAFLADEDGLMDSYPVEAMTSSQVTLTRKLGIIISTQYPKENSDFTDRVDYAKRIIDGVKEGGSIFSLLYEPDEEIAGQWQTNDNVLYQSNPFALVSSALMDNLREKREMATLYESTKSNFLCKHCNIQYKGIGTEGYVPIDKVQKCRIPKDDEFWRGKQVYLGLDLSLSTDNTAVAITTVIDGNIYARIMGFIPSDSVEIKSQKENFDYRKSIARGECIACGDDVIAYDVVENYILSLEKNLGVRVMYVGYDPWNAASTVQKLENADDPIRCSDIIQHSRFLHPATKLLEEKILNREFFYEENFLLENNFENARCVYDTNLNKYINKKKSNGKVDMLAALINAVVLLIEYEYLNKRVGCVII